jgi:hypothetical protein
VYVTYGERLKLVGVGMGWKDAPHCILIDYVVY